MIPHRIKMSGFLSYKGEQEVRFDGAALWMLAGVNGSGKSSIFDGVTYALFGHHRGGSQNAAELINKESTNLSVEFDCKLDGRVYRLKRTLRRNPKGVVAGTQQVLLQVADGTWEAVPDTGKKVDFEKWVHDRIGLTYETFTSSVLLLQGKAEKLLDARPSGRAEVLAGIVDLERYQRLYEKANARKLELKSDRDALSIQAETVPDISDMEYATALLKIDECEDARKQAQAGIDALLATEAQARRWTDAQKRLADARGKLTAAEAVLHEAVAIEKAFARLAELRGVLPAADTVVTMRGQFRESEGKSTKYLKDRDDAQQRKAGAEHALGLAKAKRDEVRKRLGDDEGKHAAVNARLRELHGLLEKVRLAEQQEVELRRLDDELARLPADPEADVRAAREEADRLAELSRVLPILERFQTERHELGEAHRSQKQEQEVHAATLKVGEERKVEAAALRVAVEAAKQARAAADHEASTARALADQARAAADEFATMAGAKNCRACGQPLTEEHFADEKRTRDTAAAAAADRFTRAVDVQTKATSVERDLTKQDAALAKQLEDLRVSYKEQSVGLKQTADAIKRLTASLALRYAELPHPYQARVAPAPAADWTQTAFPERDELVALRRDATGLPAAKQRVRAAEDVRDRWSQFRAKADAARQTLDRIRADLPRTDLDTLRQEHQAKQADEVALLNAIKGAKQTLLTSETEIDKLGKESHAAQQHLTDLAGKLANEANVRTMCDAAAERALKDLPDEWRFPVEKAGLTEYATWKAEAEHLAADGTEAKYRQLEQARGGLAALRREIGDLDAEAAAFPPDARRSPDEVKELLAAARTTFAAKDDDLQTARRQKMVFDSYREQRAKLGEQFKRIDGDFNRYKVLAELLGRDRLQRFLVRTAERQIVDYANAVLDRLSGGQLFLRLVGADDGAPADKALDLECANRITGSSAINVAFLSGSQKFRVAVSLALAIGQYASRQHRPIESVIIDEGFGCLDRQGRQVMIQELQNLRGHLHCILLVSHQEEFADAFPDGYRFELKDGATQVTRFAR